MRGGRREGCRLSEEGREGGKEGEEDKGQGWRQEKDEEEEEEIDDEEEKGRGLL